MKIYKLYIHATTQELYFTSKAVAKRVLKVLSSGRDDTGNGRVVYDPLNVEMTTLEVDPKFFLHPSTDVKIRVPYVAPGKKTKPKKDR